MHEVVQSVDAYKISIDGAEFQFAVSATDEFYPKEKVKAEVFCSSA